MTNDLLFSPLQLDQEVSFGDECHIVPVHQPNQNRVNTYIYETAKNILLSTL